MRARRRTQASRPSHCETWFSPAAGEARQRPKPTIAIVGGEDDAADAGQRFVADAITRSDGSRTQKRWLDGRQLSADRRATGYSEDMHVGARKRITGRAVSRQVISTAFSDEPAAR